MKKKHILLTAFAVSILLHILVFIFAPELKSEINSNDYLKRITKISIFQEPARPEIVKPESTPRDTMITGSRNPVRKRAPRDNEITESRNDDNSDAPRDNEITESRNDDNSGAPRDNEITESRNDDGGGAPRRSGELAVIPKVLNPKTPPYPETLEDEGIEGSVTLELLISKEGKVLKAKVIKSDHELFSESALQAVKSYKFSPGKLKDGSAADSLIEFVIKFEISL